MQSAVSGEKDLFELILSTQIDPSHHSQHSDQPIYSLSDNKDHSPIESRNTVVHVAALERGSKCR